jgi:hypothetical protein
MNLMRMMKTEEHTSIKYYTTLKISKEQILIPLFLFWSVYTLKIQTSWK